MTTLKTATSPEEMSVSLRPDDVIGPTKTSVGSRRRVAITAVGIGALLLSGGAVFAITTLEAEKPSRSQAEGALPYPSTWRERPLTDADRAAGVVAKADGPSAGSSYLGRVIKGRVTANIDLTAVGAATVKAMVASVDGFELVDTEVADVAGVAVVRMRYRQRSPDASLAEALMIIAPLPNQTAYLTLRGASGGFKRLAADGQPLIEATLRDLSRRDGKPALLTK